jgi:probable HAF family extracellular repeat protein
MKVCIALLISAPFCGAVCSAAAPKRAAHTIPASKKPVVRFRIVDIAPPDGKQLSVRGLNDHDMVVGFIPGEDAFSWQSGAFQILPTPEHNEGIDSTMENRVRAEAYAVNDDGVIVGKSGTDRPMGMSGLSASALTIWKNGKLVLWSGDMSSVGYAINKSGDIAGYYQYRGFLKRGGIVKEIETLSKLPQGNASSAAAVNDRGLVAGFTTVRAGYVVHAFLLQHGRMRDLGTLPGRSMSVATGINNHGVVAGVSSSFAQSLYSSDFAGSQAFSWRNGTMRQLPALTGAVGGRANAINDSGWIVGSCATLDKSGRAANSAALWIDNRPVNLNDCIPPGSNWNLTEAMAVNRDGHIAGNGFRHGVQHGFLLIPEPPKHH